MTDRKKRGVGRPRDEEAHQAILSAANELLLETGFARMSIEGIAARAGVAKTTIYRRWCGKGALAMEAFLQAMAPIIAFPDTGSPVADITAQVCAVARAYQGKAGKIVSEMVALGQVDGDALRAFVDGYLLPRRVQATTMLRLAIDAGQLRPEIDIELVLDALYGPIFHRMLLRHQPLSEAFARSNANMVFSALR